MLKFLLKKNFWDGFDHLLMLFVYNVGFILFGGLLFLGVYTLVVPEVSNSVIKEYEKDSPQYDWTINKDTSFEFSNVEMKQVEEKTSSKAKVKNAYFTLKDSESDETKPFISFNVKEFDYISFDHYQKTHQYDKNFVFDESKNQSFYITNEDKSEVYPGTFSKDNLSFELRFNKSGTYYLYSDNSEIVITKLRTVRPKPLVRTNAILGWVVIIVAIGLFFIPVFAFGANTRKIADFNSPNVKLFFRTMSHTWTTGFAFGVFISGIGSMVLNAVNYYWRQFGMFGSIVSFVLCAFIFVALCSLQYFIPLYFLQDNNNFKKCLKKSFIIFFDNPAFSIFLFIYNVVIGLISCVVLLVVPGIAGLQLSMMNAVRLRLKKYDWLDAHPGYINDSEKRANVPWGELIAEDKEVLGNRKFSSLLYTWK